MEVRVCGFIDILGFKNLVSRMDQDPALESLVRNVLADVLNAEYAVYEDILGGAVTDGCYAVVEGVQGLAPERAPVEMTAFSDCFAVSAPRSGVARVVCVAHRLAFRLLQQGILMRGSIVLGPLHHDGRVVFGQALIDAYQREKKACTPRIVVDRAVAEEYWALEREAFYGHEELFRGSLLSKDDDGQCFIELFVPVVERTEGTVGAWSAVWVRVFARLRNQLERKLAEQRANPVDGVGEKLAWLRRRFNASSLKHFPEVPTLPEDA